MITSFKIWYNTCSDVTISERLENQEYKVINTNELTSEDQYKFGNAAVVEQGHIVAYHVSDDPDKLIQMINSGKQLTATYRKGVGKHAELGPGLYVSGIPNFWLNRSRSKWDFLDNLTDQQRESLADKLKNDKVLTGVKLDNGKIYKYITDNERNYAIRDINSWLQNKHNPILVMLAGQPFNIAFWKDEYLKTLGIDPSPTPKIVKFKLEGKFADLNNNVLNWPVISDAIRKGLDGGFSKGGWSNNAELAIWKRTAIKNYTLINSNDL